MSGPRDDSKLMAVDRFVFADPYKVANAMLSGWRENGAVITIGFKSSTTFSRIVQRGCCAGGLQGWPHPIHWLHLYMSYIHPVTSI